MKASETARAPETPLAQDLLHAARYYLGGRKGLIALAVVIAIAGAALNWSWLVAAGFVPLLLGALPCLAMCALGLCMNKMSGKSCSAGTDATKSAAPGASSSPQVLPATAASVERIEPIRDTPARPEDRTAADGKTADFVQTPTPDERK
jgi:hypothetical protein